jgi:hypothetical protein
VLKDEGGFGSALPEAGEEHQEEAQLSDKKHGPDTGLGQDMHRRASGEKGGERSQSRKQEKDQPYASEMVSKQPEGRAKGAANTAVGLVVGSKVRTELNDVGLDQVEVDAQ